MTSQESEFSRYASTAVGAIEPAAATATAEVSRWLAEVSRVSRRRRKDVAELLGVSEGRVSEVLTGDGNITVAALAKYARAYGYSLTFQLVPVDEGVPPVDVAPKRR